MLLVTSFAIILLQVAMLRSAGASRAGELTLSQYDQVGAEVNGSLSIPLLQARIAATHANTFSFLLWDIDGHQYLDMVQFLEQSKGFTVDGRPLSVWVTLIPPSENRLPPVPAPNFTNCIHCPASRPFVYGGGGSHGKPATGGGFCCPVKSVDGDHCPGVECCLAPIPGPVGCEGVKRCGTNPTNRPACPPTADAGTPLLPRVHRVPPSRQGTLLSGAPPVPKGEARCSVPADSPLTAFNETAMVNSSKGWRGCNDFAGWSKIIGKLALQYPMLKVLNVDDFSSNVPHVFDQGLISEMRSGLAVGGVKLIPTFYYTGLATPWLAKSTDGALFYFRNDKEGQAQCGHPSAANGGLCTPPLSTEDGHSTQHSPTRIPTTQAQVNRDLSAARQPDCTACCLSGARAELSLRNLGAEIADFVKALPAGHPLHIGLYFSAYHDCVTPSPSYTRQALIGALANPAVSGATVYTFQTPQHACASPLSKEKDKGCIVEAIFRNYSAFGASQSRLTEA